MCDKIACHRLKLVLAACLLWKDRPAPRIRKGNQLSLPCFSDMHEVVLQLPMFLHVVYV